MKIIKEVINDIEHIPKCPRSNEINLIHVIRAINKKLNID